MQKHIPSTSSLFVGPDESFGGDQRQNLVSRRFADIQLDHGDEPAVFLRPGHRSRPGEKEFLHSTSFDSSDDEMLPARLPKGVLESGNRALSENDSSDNTEIDGTEERKNLFEFVRCYKPRETELRTILRPFVPDYIPAVGVVDEFIKVPRPDGLPDYLGLKILDESGSNQSDPAIITLQLRASTMQSSQSVEVATVENPEQNPRKVDAWIESMKSLHRLKLPSTVTYSNPMPDMETLIQRWAAGYLLGCR